MGEGKAEMTTKKLSMLLFLLAVVWVLCYNAEQQIPERLLQQTFGRMDSQQIQPDQVLEASKVVETLEFPQDILHFPENERKLKEVEGTEVKESEICVIIAQGEEKKVNGRSAWELLLGSVFEQSYSNLKIYYFGNANNGAAINDVRNRYKYPSDRFKYIPNEFPKAKLENLVVGAKLYCKEKSIVVPLIDSDLLLHSKAFSLVNALLKERQFIWSAYMNKDKKLGKAFPYNFGINIFNYPFVATGLQAFRYQSIKKVEEKVFKSEQTNDYFKLATKMGLGMPILTNVAEKEYVKEVLLLEREEEMYVTLDMEMKKEIQEIRNHLLQERQIVD